MGTQICHRCQPSFLKHFYFQITKKFCKAANTRGQPFKTDNSKVPRYHEIRSYQMYESLANRAQYEQSKA